MSYTQIQNSVSNFLTAPIDLFTKTPNNFVNNRSISKITKVALIIISTLMTWSSFGLSYGLGRLIKPAAPEIAGPRSIDPRPFPIDLLDNTFDQNEPKAQAGACSPGGPSISGEVIISRVE